MQECVFLHSKNVRVMRTTIFSPEDFAGRDISLATFFPLEILAEIAGLRPEENKNG